jgi:hypothetical protein
MTFAWSDMSVRYTQVKPSRDGVLEEPKRAHCFLRAHNLHVYVYYG